MTEEEYKKEIIKLKNLNNELEEQVYKLKQEIGNLHEQIGELEIQVGELEDEIDDLTSTICDLEEVEDSKTVCAKLLRDLWISLPVQTPFDEDIENTLKNIPGMLGRFYTPYFIKPTV